MIVTNSNELSSNDEYKPQSELLQQSSSTFESLKMVKPKLKKRRTWTQQEDDKMLQLIQSFGPSKWALIAKQMNGRVGKQCRERWHNHLKPSIKRDPWTGQEEWILFLFHKAAGNRWAEISKLIPGRSDNSIKNYWNSNMKKKINKYLRKYKKIVKLQQKEENDDYIDQNIEEAIIKELLYKNIELGKNDYHTTHGIHGTSLRKRRKKQSKNYVNLVNQAQSNLIKHEKRIYRADQKIQKSQKSSLKLKINKKQFEESSTFIDNCDQTDNKYLITFNNDSSETTANSYHSDVSQTQAIDFHSPFFLNDKEHQGLDPKELFFKTHHASTDIQLAERKSPCFKVKKQKSDEKDYFQKNFQDTRNILKTQIEDEYPIQYNQLLLSLPNTFRNNSNEKFNFDNFFEEISETVKQNQQQQKIFQEYYN